MALCSAHLPFPQDFASSSNRTLQFFICLTNAANHIQMCMQGTEPESKLSLYRHRVWITIKIAPRSPSAQRKAVCKCLHTGCFLLGVHNTRWAIHPEPKLPGLSPRLQRLMQEGPPGFSFDRPLLVYKDDQKTHFRGEGHLAQTTGPRRGTQPLY